MCWLGGAAERAFRPRAVDHPRAPDTVRFKADVRSYFEITDETTYGGTLLGPLLASRCTSPDMTDDPEGRDILKHLYATEHELIAAGRFDCRNRILVGIPQPLDDGPDLDEIFSRHTRPPPTGAVRGIAGPLQPWLAFNTEPALSSARAAEVAAPFPLPALMYQTAGLEANCDVARHGADILEAFAATDPTLLADVGAVLDFGVGVGRVARYFKGFEGRYAGVDIDPANVDWVRDALPWVELHLVAPEVALPFEPCTFDAATTFMTEDHARGVVGENFTVARYVRGAIHRFQDLIVLRRD